MDNGIWLRRNFKVLKLVVAVLLSFLLVFNPLIGPAGSVLGAGSTVSPEENDSHEEPVNVLSNAASYFDQMLTGMNGEESLDSLQKTSFEFLGRVLQDERVAGAVNEAISGGIQEGGETEYACLDMPHLSDLEKIFCQVLRDEELVSILGGVIAEHLQGEEFLDFLAQITADLMDLARSDEEGSFKAFFKAALTDFTEDGRYETVAEELLGIVDNFTGEALESLQEEGGALSEIEAEIRNLFINPVEEKIEEMMDEELDGRLGEVVNGILDNLEGVSDDFSQNLEEDEVFQADLENLKDVLLDPLTRHLLGDEEESGEIDPLLDRLMDEVVNPLLDDLLGVCVLCEGEGCADCPDSLFQPLVDVLMGEECEVCEGENEDCTECPPKGPLGEVLEEISRDMDLLLDAYVEGAAGEGNGDNGGCCWNHDTWDSGARGDGCHQCPSGSAELHVAEFLSFWADTLFGLFGHEDYAPIFLDPLSDFFDEEAGGAGAEHLDYILDELFDAIDDLMDFEEGPLAGVIDEWMEGFPSLDPYLDDFMEDERFTSAMDEALEGFESEEISDLITELTGFLEEITEELFGEPDGEEDDEGIDIDELVDDLFLMLEEAAVVNDVPLDDLAVHLQEENNAREMGDNFAESILHGLADAFTAEDEVCPDCTETEMCSRCVEEEGRDADREALRDGLTDLDNLYTSLGGELSEEDEEYPVTDDAGIADVVIAVIVEIALEDEHFEGFHASLEGDKDLLEEDLLDYGHEFGVAAVGFLDRIFAPLLKLLSPRRYVHDYDADKQALLVNMISEDRVASSLRWLRIPVVEFLTKSESASVPDNIISRFLVDYEAADVIATPGRFSATCEVMAEIEGAEELKELEAGYFEDDLSDRISGYREKLGGSIDPPAAISAANEMVEEMIDDATPEGEEDFVFTVEDAGYTGDEAVNMLVDELADAEEMLSKIAEEAAGDVVNIPADLLEPESESRGVTKDLMDASTEKSLQVMASFLQDEGLADLFHEQVEAVTENLLDWGINGLADVVTDHRSVGAVEDTLVGVLTDVDFLGHVHDLLQKFLTDDGWIGWVEPANIWDETQWVQIGHARDVPNSCSEAGDEEHDDAYAYAPQDGGGLKYLLYLSVHFACWGSDAETYTDSRNTGEIEGFSYIDPADGNQVWHFYDANEPTGDSTVETIGISWVEIEQGGRYGLNAVVETMTEWIEGDFGTPPSDYLPTYMSDFITDVVADDFVPSVVEIASGFLGEALTYENENNETLDSLLASAITGSLRVEDDAGLPAALGALLEEDPGNNISGLLKDVLVGDLELLDDIASLLENNQEAIWLLEQAANTIIPIFADIGTYLDDPAGGRESIAGLLDDLELCIDAAELKSGLHIEECEPCGECEGCESGEMCAGCEGPAQMLWDVRESLLGFPLENITGYLKEETEEINGKVVSRAYRVGYIMENIPSRFMVELLEEEDLAGFAGYIVGDHLAPEIVDYEVGRRTLNTMAGILNSETVFDLSVESIFTSLINLYQAFTGYITSFGGFVAGSTSSVSAQSELQESCQESMLQSVSSLGKDSLQLLMGMESAEDGSEYVVQEEVSTAEEETIDIDEVVQVIAAALDSMDTALLDEIIFNLLAIDPQDEDFLSIQPVKEILAGIIGDDETAIVNLSDVLGDVIAAYLLAEVTEGSNILMEETGFLYNIAYDLLADESVNENVRGILADVTGHEETFALANNLIGGVIDVSYGPVAALAAEISSDEDGRIKDIARDLAAELGGLGPGVEEGLAGIIEDPALASLLEDLVEIIIKHGSTAVIDLLEHELLSTVLGDIAEVPVDYALQVVARIAGDEELFGTLMEAFGEAIGTEEDAESYHVALVDAVERLVDGLVKREYDYLGYSGLQDYFNSSFDAIGVEAPTRVPYGCRELDDENVVGEMLGPEVAAIIPDMINTAFFTWLISGGAPEVDGETPGTLTDWGINAAGVFDWDLFIDMGEAINKEIGPEVTAFVDDITDEGNPDNIFNAIGDLLVDFDFTAIAAEIKGDPRLETIPGEFAESFVGNVPFAGLASVLEVEGLEDGEGNPQTVYERLVEVAHELIDFFDLQGLGGYFADPNREEEITTALKDAITGAPLEELLGDISFLLSGENSHAFLVALFEYFAGLPVENITGFMQEEYDPENPGHTRADYTGEVLPSFLLNLASDFIADESLTDFIYVKADEIINEMGDGSPGSILVDILLDLIEAGLLHDLLEELLAESEEEGGTAELQEVSSTFWEDASGYFMQTMEDLYQSFMNLWADDGPKVGVTPQQDTTEHINEDFEDTTFPPADWSDCGSANGWDRSTDEAASGDASAISAVTLPGGNNQYWDTTLYTPYFEIPAGSEASLVFQIIAIGGDDRFQGFNVIVQDDGGGELESDSLTYEDAGSGNWAEYELDLSSYAGDEIRIVFEAQNAAHRVGEGGAGWSYFHIDDVLVTSIAEEETYTLTMAASPEAGGTATDVTDAGPYTVGTLVDIDAESAEGYEFSHWSAPAGSFDNANVADTTFTMPAQDVTVTANFTAIEYTLTMAGDGNGTATDVTDAGPYTVGTLVDINAEPAEDYEFSLWSAPAGSFDNANVADTTFTMPAQDVTVTAHFTEFKYTLFMESTEGGSTNPDGELDLDYGEVIPIEAIPDNGYEFVNWEATAGIIGDEYEENTTFTMPEEDATLTAHFSPVDYTLTIGSSEGGSVVVPGEGDFIHNYEDEIAIEAEADEGYVFVSWEATAGVVGDEEEKITTFTMPAENAALTAVFAETVELTLEANPPEAGAVEDLTGDGHYPEGKIVSVTAQANSGWRFDNWTVGGVEVSGEATFDFEMPGEDTVLVANFVEAEYKLTLKANPSAGGTVQDNTGDGYYAAGTMINVSADPIADYEFVNWTVGGTEVSSEPTFDFEMPDDDVTLTANFQVEGLVHIPDDKLREAVKFSLWLPFLAESKEEILVEDMEKLRTLSACGRGIEDLSGLEHAVNLKHLDLSGNKINDLSPLSELTGLEELHLAYNDISDLGDLEDLAGNLEPGEEPALVELDLSHNTVDNINALSDMSGLRRLNLNGNNVADISALENLTSLQRLYLSDNDISLIGALGNLVNMVRLDLSRNVNVENISVLGGMEHLKRLNLSLTGIGNGDLAHLEGLSALESLDLSGNMITELNALEEWPNLEMLQTLDLSSAKLNDEEERFNDINDLSPLEGMGLAELHLSGNSGLGGSLGALALMDSLEALYLADAGIGDVDLAQLTGLKGLKRLGLSGNNLSDLSNLLIDCEICDGSGEVDGEECAECEGCGKALSLLRYFYLGNNNISDLEPLQGMTMKELDLSHNDSNNISSLARVDFIQVREMVSVGIRAIDFAFTGFDFLDAHDGGGFLNLSGNQVSDITPLRGKRLYALDLSNNELDGNSLAGLLPGECPVCGGDGDDGGEDCDNCDGDGEAKITFGSFLGGGLLDLSSNQIENLNAWAVCPMGDVDCPTCTGCDGTGEIEGIECGECGGSGLSLCGSCERIYRMDKFLPHEGIAGQLDLIYLCYNVMGEIYDFNMDWFFGVMNDDYVAWSILTHIRAGGAAALARRDENVPTGGMALSAGEEDGETAEGATLMEDGTEVIEGATVTALENREGGEVVATGVTDEEGKFELGVPGGNYLLRIEHLLFETAEMEIEVDRGGTMWVPEKDVGAVEMKPLGLHELNLIARDVTGEELSEAVIKLIDKETGETKTSTESIDTMEEGGEGIYILAAPEGSFRLEADHPGFLPLVIEEVVVNEDGELEGVGEVLVLERYGDILNNGAVSIADVMEVLRHAAGLDALDEDALRRARVSVESEEVGVRDAVLILQKVVGLLDEFPIENIE